MATIIDYALMAGASYIDTRLPINRFPIPTGWNLVSRNPQDNTSGFEAATFGNSTTIATSTDIVISYAGTYDIPSNPLTNPDMLADAGLGFGTGSIQLLQAADYYLQVKASAPAGAHFTLTGHSLGGGLAALIGVFFGETAVTFDQAPFAQTALFQAQSLLDYLSAETNGSGAPLYTAVQLQGLTNFIQQQQVDGGIPNSGLVTNINVQGEFLSGVPWNIADRIGATVENIGNTAPGVAGTELHSIALLTAFLQSQQTATAGQTLNDVTAKLPDLLAMLFDDKLFASRTDTGIENLLERLVKHEAGMNDAVTGATTLPADQMTDRFTRDLWKLAQDGGMTLKDGNSNSTWVSRALSAFAMQKYYEETQDSAGYKKELFTDLATEGGSGGIRFDMADVSEKFATALSRNAQLNLTDAKGFDLYLKYFFDNNLDVNDVNFTAAEDQLILSQLPSMRDWFVQAGTGGMTATDTLNRGDFMLGGAGTDTLTGGNKTDLLVGNAGADILKGGKGNDTLIGGTGFDRYIENAGDGFDTILDRDSAGVILFGAIEAKGSAALTDPTKWYQLGTDTWADTQNGIVYLRSIVDGETRLLVKKGDSSALVKGWAADNLGITLSAGAALAEPVTLLTYTGDQRAPLQGDGTYDWNATAWAADGTLVGGVAEANFNDVIYGSAGADRMDGLGGNDALDGGTGNDRIDGGAGDDLIGGGAGSDLIYGESGNDTILSSTGLSALQRYKATDVWNPPAGTTVKVTGSTWGVYINPNGSETIYGGGSLIQDDQPDIIYAGDGNDLVLGGRGDDFIDGGNDNDTLWGNGGSDIIDGGAGDDTIVGDGLIEQGHYQTTPESLNGNDVLIGGAGKDTILGGGGNDLLLGGTEDDSLYGEDGADVLDGGQGNDQLDGGSGDDVYINVIGNDTIHDVEGNNTIAFANATGLGASGLSTSTFTANDGSTGLQLNIALDNGETLSLESFFSSTATLQFANGNTLDLETLVSENISTSLNLSLGNAGGKLYGALGNDGLNGGAGDDILAGHKGSDILSGGLGNDLYEYNLGDDWDSIIDVGGDNDVLRFGAGISPDDIDIVRWWSSTGEDALELDVLDSTGKQAGSILIRNYFMLDDGTNRVERIEFADDTVWTYADIQVTLPKPTEGSDPELEGFAGNDVIDGLAGDDQINGKAGDDTLYGGQGNDSLAGSLGNDTLYGGVGDDWLFGNSFWFGDGDAGRNDTGMDTLDGGPGNDYLVGGPGNDVYIFGRGYGYDKINEMYQATGVNTGTDTLRLTAGVLPSDVSLLRDFNDLVLVIDTSNTQIRVIDHFSDVSSQIERIEFDGGAGPAWTVADIAAYAQAGTQNSMTGGPGDDIYVVDHYLDTIVEAGNSGTDTVYASNSYILPNNVENLTLTGYLNIDAIGNALDNVLIGNIGDNTLEGWNGTDIAYGGQGNDLYFEVEQIVEYAGEGIDTWFSPEGGVLPDNVENLTMGGTYVSHWNSTYATYAPVAVGNTLDNLLVSGGFGKEYWLDGKSGADTMVISGKDIATVYIDNPGDKVVGTPYETRSYIDYTMPDALLNKQGEILQVGARLILLGNDATTGIGNSADNYLDATQNSASNILKGGAGNDHYRITGNDSVVELSGEGYDTIDIYSTPVNYSYSMEGMNVEEVILDGNGTVTGSASDDVMRIYGSGTLFGGAGDDSLQGSSYSTLAGGTGNDVYYVSPDFYGVLATIVENFGEGYDKVIVSNGQWNTSILPQNVEAGGAIGNGAGISGNELDNYLEGDLFSNWINGGSGADLMVGGDGTDFYFVDNYGDQALETLGGGNGDTVYASIDYTLPEYVEQLVLNGLGNLNGTGNSSANTLTGNDAANVLDGSVGADTMTGGVGDDTYVVDNLGDVVSETSTLSTEIDTVQSSVTYTLGANIENLTLTGIAVIDGTGNELANVMRGNSAVNTLNGLDGNDTIYAGDTDSAHGGNGNDTLISENTTSWSYLWGEAGDDVLMGGSYSGMFAGGLGNDIITGGVGMNFIWGDDQDMTGGGVGGNDTITGGNDYDYVIAGQGDDVVYGNGGSDNLSGNQGNDRLYGGAGDDTLIGGPSGTSANTFVSNLVIHARGTPVLDVYPTMQVYVDGALIQEFVVDATSYTAYTVDPAKLGMSAGKVDVVFTNDAWRPDIGQDRNLYVQKIEVNGQMMNATDNGVFYDSGSGATAFDGINLRSGQEALGSNGALRFALGDNDTLDGGTGADQMTGGSGNDTYLVDNVGDVLTELANEGMDTVRSSITYTLGANLENLILTGTTAINGTGNTAHNLLMGNAGNNNLYGDSGADTLIGNGGNDRLDGGAGNDILQGGQGNDTYVVDSSGDRVAENANQGLDTVESSINYTLGANVENLTLTGTAAINGTGNELNNSLIGNSASNTLSGGVGNDTLDGGAGADIMIGGVGDDYYVIDNAGDIVIENAGEGTADSVELHLDADYTLGFEIERSYRYGSGNWTTTGNASDNYLYGGIGNDTLIGLAGNDLLWGDAGTDTLIGGTGNDRYYVESAGDVVVENANEGVDTVYVFGSAAYTLTADVENGYRTFWEGSLTGNELNNSLNGSWGVDVLDGAVGADTLIGYGGNDTLDGGTGNDTYIMGRGYAADTVIENDATAGNTDVAQFLTGVSADQIWFQHVGNDLEASIIGTADKLVVQDWYLGNANHIEQFKTTDGARTLLDSNVQNLVNAMASFAPPAAGQTNLPSNYQTTLAPVIAANWQ